MIDLQAKYKHVNYNELGKSDLLVSECGFGTYRVSSRIKEHRDALTAALVNGINLIDTSSNYTDGQSEELIGDILADLVDKKRIDRNNLVIVTKGGYIQGKNLESAQQKEKNGNAYHEIVKCAPDLWHCIHPDFLKDQISDSLSRMKLAKIDIYLLHNPEYFLSYTPTNDEESLRKEYYSRIKKAFEYLEKEVKKGRIKYYGISSNTFVEDSDKRNFTSLEKVLEAADEIDKQNHFLVVEFPLNLIEPDAVKNLNQENDSKSVLELAKENNLGVLINRPLNGISGNKLIRLADYKIKEDRSHSEVLDLISDLIKTEEKIRDRYLEEIETDKIKQVEECLTVGKILHNNFDRFETVHHFTDSKKQYLIPRTNYAIAEIYKINTEDNDRINELNQFATLVNITMDSIESLLAKDQNIRNKEIHKKLDNYISSNHALSQKAIKMINSLQGVSSVLIGMRSEEYVKDIFESMQLEKIDNAENYFTDN